jgi:hypothetical protein
MNTKIKLIKRKSYGFANFEHLRLKLLAGASQLCNKYKYSGNSFVEIGTTQL